METPIITAIITSGSAILVAALTFYLTKRYELRREWRQKKLDHYKEFLSAISDLAVDGIDKEKANKRLALAANTISLVAPQNVIIAWMNFHQEIKYTNPNRTLEKHDRLLVELVLAIRRDVNLTTRDNKKTFVFRLIGSAPPKR
jgi:hypothetical protein